MSTAPEADPRRLRQIFESAMDGIFIADPTGRFVDANPSACEMLRCTREELLGKRISDIVEPEDLRARPIDFTGMASDAGVRSARRLLAGDGAVVHAEVWARSLADGYFVGIARDVSERHAARAALERSEATFRALIEALPDGVAVHRDGRYVYANPAIMKLMGYTDPSAVIGAPVDRFVHPDDRGVVRARIHAMLTRNEPAPANEERLVRADGSMVHCEISGLPVVFQGRPAALALVRDVTERRQIQAQLALTDRMASVGTLVAGVAHEINNPLAYLLLNVESLASSLPRVARALAATRAALGAALGGEATEDDVSAALAAALGDEAAALAAWTEPARVEELAAAAREALTGARRVQQIVRDLKTFSHVEEGQRVAVRLDAVLDTVLDMAGNQLKYHARIERDYAPTLPAIVADEGRLSQVFLNLVLNAAQAIPEGDPARNVVRVRTAALDDGARVRVDVEDSGVGIPPEHRSRLFVPFFTTKPVGVGSGLGLFVCHNIVRALGGRIDVESTPGRGSRFSVTLPVAVPGAPHAAAGAPHAAQAPVTAAEASTGDAAAISARDAAEPSARDTAESVAATAASAGVASRAPRWRVLVVDDEPLLRASLATTLANNDGAVVACGSGAEALALLARDRAFDAVLCDLMMPEPSGMDLYEWTRAHAPAVTPRFVFMTGGAFTARADAFVGQTAQPVLEKPFATAQLLAALDEVAKNWRGR